MAYGPLSALPVPLNRLEKVAIGQALKGLNTGYASEFLELMWAPVLVQLPQNSVAVSVFLY